MSALQCSCLLLLLAAPALARPVALSAHGRKLACSDNRSDCTAWGPGLCTDPGVATDCPCMCGVSAATPNPSPVPTSPCPSTSTTTSTDEMVAGVKKSEFTAVFITDSDRCGDCPDKGSITPNTQAVIDTHWGFFTSATTSLGFSFGDRQEAAIFFGHMRHEYGGVLEKMMEFCGRKDPSGAQCPAYSGGGFFFGRGPLQLTHDYNYKYVGAKPQVNLPLGTDPTPIADNTKDYGWKAALIFWTDTGLNCGGSWLTGPTCVAAGRVGDLASTTKRINPIECGATANQDARIQQVQYVWNNAFPGLPALDPTKLRC